MESSAHKDYVRNAMIYVERCFGIPREFIACDLDDSNQTPEIVINGYRPDIFVHTPSIVIIAEAKTDNDILNRHTDDQIESYIHQLLLYDQDRHLIMSSSMAAYPTIRNYIRRLRKRYNLSSITFHTVDPFKKGEVLL